MQTFTLPEGQRLTVTADANSIGIFWRLSDSVGEEPYAPTALTAGNSGTAGPFNTSTRWAIDSSVGELTHSSAVMTPLPQEGGEMSGNITMASTETVDGRDISVDGAALDNVDSIAEILVLLKTVDGTGSGLDADLVDGVEAAAINQLAVAQETTKQHNFNATTLTSLGADSVPNGAFTDGSDFAVNGDFASGDQDWTKGTGWTIPTSDAQSDGNQSADADLVNTGITVSAGEAYLVTFTISSWTAGNCTPVVGAQEGTDRGSASTFAEVIVATDTTPLTFRADSNFIGTIDDITIVQAGDAGWTQGTGWLISGGTATSNGDQSADADLEDDANAPGAGNKYEVIYTVSNYSAGNVTAVVGNQEGTDRSSNATFTELIVASNTDVLKIRADLNFIGDIDTVSMKLANVSWDLDDNQVCTITLDQNVVIDNPTNMKDGGEYILHLIQDGTGTRIPTWGSAFKFEGGSPPTLTTTSTTGHDVLSFVSDGSSMFYSGGKFDLS